MPKHPSRKEQGQCYFFSFLMHENEPTRHDDSCEGTQAQYLYDDFLAPVNLHNGKIYGIANGGATEERNFAPFFLLFVENDKDSAKDVIASHLNELKDIQAPQSVAANGFHGASERRFRRKLKKVNTPGVVAPQLRRKCRVADSGVQGAKSFLFYRDRKRIWRSGEINWDCGHAGKTVIPHHMSTFFFLPIYPADNLPI